MRISVLGCGRWGSFHAWYSDHIGHEVMLYGRESSKNMQYLMESRTNDYLKLPETVKLTTDLSEAVDFADVIIISISAQQLRSFVKKQLLACKNIQDKKFVLAMKGLENHEGKRLTTVFEEETKSLFYPNKLPDVAVWVGPGHVQDFLQGIPNCMIMASKDDNLTKELVDIFKSPLIRFYYGSDLIGIEIGAAAKNVIGLAAGMLDGLKYSSLKGALMARGTAELSRLIEALGGDRMTVYGLSHLGDYEATLFSAHSHNRRFGEDFVLNRSFTKLAEGVETVSALMKLSETANVELPICETVNNIIHKHKEPKEQLLQLFLRSTKSE